MYVYIYYLFIHMYRYRIANLSSAFANAGVFVQEEQVSEALLRVLLGRRAVRRVQPPSIVMIITYLLPLLWLLLLITVIRGATGAKTSPTSDASFSWTINAQTRNPLNPQTLSDSEVDGAYVLCQHQTYTRLCLGPYGSPRGGGGLLRARYPCSTLTVHAVRRMRPPPRNPDTLSYY